MRKVIFLLLFVSTYLISRSQVTEPPPATPLQPNTTVEQQLENITENNEDMETEDDSYQQELLVYQKNPVNLNTVPESVLKEMRILSPIQIQNLISYRQLLGNLLSIYELQAVPAFDIATIQRLRPYVTVSTQPDYLGSLGSRLHGGDNTVLVRVTQVLEKSQGYLVDPASGRNYYPGSPQKLYVRYRYNYKNLLQYGVVGEKDAGEQFFKGYQKNGFDFYSAHFFARRIGIIKSLALGDYTVNMGQGLTQWMSLTYKKGPDVLATKRQADVLRPYNSAGEINFHRGAGITLAKGNWEATVFGSYKKVDANFNGVDSLTTFDDFVSSLQTTGLHRTKSEAEDKGVQRQLAFGGNIAYQWKTLHIGVNGIHYNFKYPLTKQSEPYNLYALSGKSFGNYSADYSYTYKNFHFFGESAISEKKYTAFINGLLISTASNVDMSFLYRNISKGYQSLYTNAFTESTYPTNEKGFFSGISVHPASAWRVDAYVDMYKFPWLKYRVNAPAPGTDYLFQVTYRPNKVFEMYARFKSETKSINYNPDELVMSPVVPQPKQDLRTQFSYKVNPQFTFRGRAEAVWFDKKGKDKETGMLIFADLIYNPVMKPFSANMRLQYFETDGYNSRLYAFENDVLYSFTIPVFYGKGYRYYINLNYDLGRHLSFWVRFSQFIYPDNKTIGSSLDLIQGQHKTEAKLQMMYKF